MTIQVPFSVCQFENNYTFVPNDFINKMVTKVTSGVKISVETFYQSQYSDPRVNHFVFAYRIVIENNSEQPIQLKRRHWIIIDADGQHREVEGEGVIGEQPIITPGDKYTYVSGCNLNCEIGKMYGSYEMIRTSDNRKFKVKIPEFIMTSDGKNN
jgi:ApaG protein